MDKVNKDKLLDYLLRQREKSNDNKIKSHYYKLYAVVKSGRFDTNTD